MLSAMFKPVLRGIFPRHKERGDIGKHDEKRGYKMTDLNELPKAKKHYPRCLRFVLKGVWFDKIKSGEKRIEYREVKP